MNELAHRHIWYECIVTFISCILILTFIYTLPIRAWNGIHTTTFQKIHKRLKKWGEIFFVRSKSSTFDKICCVQKSKIIYLRLLVHGTQSEEEDRTKLLIFQMFGDITALKAGISSSSCAEINSTEWNLSPHKSY